MEGRGYNSKLLRTMPFQVLSSPLSLGSLISNDDRAFNNEKQEVRALYTRRVFLFCTYLFSSNPRSEMTFCAVVHDVCT